MALLAAAGLAMTGCAGNAAVLQPVAVGEPKLGGELKVGVVGGSAKDTVDAHAPVTHPDQARIIQLYDTLTAYDTDHKVQMSLAESVTPSKDARQWTIKLRPGLKFSDGSALNADDVVASFRRVTNPDELKSVASALAGINRDGVKALDETSVLVPFSNPVSTFPDILASYAFGVVPVEYDVTKPVGAGPFMLESFTPGSLSRMVKNPHYWRAGQPKLDAVTIFDFPDDTARVNALLGGQVDAIDQLPMGQVPVIAASNKLSVLESPSGSWLPFTMRVDKPPFDDVRVRQALRLVVDRQQMVDQVMGGHGTIGNDMYAPLDACYPQDIPQRTQDIEGAKKLLKEAGQENLTVELTTSPVAAGLVEAAQVFAEQASKAGITVKVNRVDPGVFYGQDYLSWDFAQDFWFTRDYIGQADNSGTPDAPFNETHWNNPQWTALVEEAKSTLDETKRCELIAQAQQIEFDEGGFIIWGFPNSVDAHANHVQGLVPDASGIPLTSFGFRNVWLNK